MFAWDKGPAGHLKRFFRQLPGYSVAGLIQPLLSVLLLPIFSYYISLAEFGVFALLQVVAVVFGLCTTLGLTAMVPFYYTEEPDPVRRRKKMGNLVLWLSLINFTALGVFLLAGRWLFELVFPSVPFHPYIVITLLTGVLPPYIDVAAGIWQIKEKPSAVAAINIFRAVVGAGGQLGLVIGLGWGLIGLLWGTFGGLLASAMLGLVLVRREMAWGFDLAELRRALRVGVPMLPNNLFANAYRFADRVILEHFVSHEQIGIYYVALRFGDLLKIGTGVISQALLPIVYKDAGQPGDRSSLARLFTLCLGLIATGAVVVGFASEWYIARTMDPSFYPAVYLVFAVMIAQLLKGAYVFPHLAIWSAKRTYYFPVITIIPMLVSIGLNLWLIPVWGIYSAVAVTIVAFGLHAALTYHFGQRSVRLPYQYLRMGLVFAAGVGALTVFSPVVLGWPWWLRLSLGLVLFLGVVGPVVGGAFVARPAGSGPGGVGDV
jgi:O-antigen/teichoic acid export membrane protein